jgi:hypothetical protein
MARRLYVRGLPVSWPDVNLPRRWHLNIRWVPVPPVPRDGPERVQEIHHRRTLLTPALRRDPVFAIKSPAWDYVLPPELTEDEELQVAILVSAEEEKQAFPGLKDALAISVAPPPPP